MPELRKHRDYSLHPLTNRGYTLAFEEWILKLRGGSLVEALNELANTDDRTLFEYGQLFEEETGLEFVSVYEG